MSFAVDIVALSFATSNVMLTAALVRRVNPQRRNRPPAVPQAAAGEQPGRLAVGGTPHRAGGVGLAPEPAASSVTPLWPASHGVTIEGCTFAPGSGGFVVGETMTREEVAALLGRSHRTIRRLGAYGHLDEVARPGRATLVTRESALAYARRTAS